MTAGQDSFDVETFRREMDASQAEIADLQTFRSLLEVHSAEINLVGPSAMASFWRRHAFDSAQVLHVEQSAQVWADVGAGAGFPGVILAILLRSRALRPCVHLIESMAKRVRFLEQVSLALGLPVVIHHARAEAISAPLGVQVVTARACAPLPRLLGYTQHFFQAGAKGVFLKGRDAESELTEARRTWSIQAELLPSRSDPSGRIVHIERLSPRGR